MPELALPFALVGAAGGWISARFLANPLIAVIPSGQEYAAAICASVTAALVGKALTRWCGNVSPFADPNVIRVRLVFAVILGGAAAGGVTGEITGHRAQIMLSGVLNGAICAIAFLPICAAVLAAARRAERARLGSIVAGADRREVWGILAATLAVASLAALPDWPASAARITDAPTIALEWAIAAAALGVGIFAADAVALARVARAVRGSDLEERDRGALAEGTSTPRVDLGLGDGVLARIGRQAAAYRSRERALSLVLGSPDEARAALRRALVRGGAGIAISALALAAHGVAAAHGRVPFEEIRCSRGVTRSCHESAKLLEASGDVDAAISFHDRACAAGDRRSCAELGRMYEAGEGAPGDDDVAMRYREQACELLDAASCRELARLKIRHHQSDKMAPTAAYLLAKACSWGDRPSCDGVAAFQDETASAPPRN